jgi:NADPH:quinone reductase-like Zn-dependent oxidoreductase
LPRSRQSGWFDHGQPGQRVLIHGGAGGLGHFAIQFAEAKAPRRRPFPIETSSAI